MKAKITFVIALLIITISFAQNGINYKAVIKDTNGNVVANDLIQVQFTILQGETTVYEETHSPTTDANGIVIVNIGEGTPISGIFTTIDWASDDHFLNVRINTGSGLVDMGTTQFKMVPYALNAANVTGLQAIDEGNGIGWRLIGQDPINYGNIGTNAVDLSSNPSSSETIGATGSISVAMGSRTIASGNESTAMGRFSIASGPASTAMGSSTTASQFGSTAMGSSTVASGLSSTAMGSFTTASGQLSTAMGFITIASGFASTAMGHSTQAPSYVETVIGRYNTAYVPNSTASWSPSDRLFVIGNGTGPGSRLNAMTVLKNGHVGLGTDSPRGELDVDGTMWIGSAEFFQDGGTFEIAYFSDLRPYTDDGFNLGTASYRWNEIYATNGSINTSDRRDKTNITDLAYGLDEVMKLKPKSFNWKTKPNQDKKLGLIAQDLLKVIPEVVKTHEDVVIDEKDPTQKKRVEMERMGVYYSDLIPVLIKAIQEQQTEIQELKDKLKDKDASTTELYNRLNRIERLLKTQQ